mmetsp:Transcript_1931/g.4251  ORF Transcript_1931/g.4251 Transcript_1931/m.4251 type:complete len:251 (-) Transcript_1931:101-853(-)
MRLALAPLLLVAHGAALRVQTACNCLSWKDVYENRGVTCGQGYELGEADAKISVKQAQAKAQMEGSTLYQTMCSGPKGVGFFPRVSFSKCLNTNFKYPVSGRWCYVSPDCIGAEQVPGANAAIRMCTGEDDLLNTTSPEELIKLGKDSRVDPRVLAKLSYNIAPEMWREVQQAAGAGPDKFKLDDPELEQIMQEEAKSALEKVQATGVPTIYDNDSHEGGGIMVRGSQLWQVRGVEHAGWVYQCLKGCPE